MRDKFQEFLSRHKSSKLAIAMHRNADLDALCSAYALSTLLPNAVLVTPDEMNLPARSLAKDLGVKVFLFSQLNRLEYDGLIVVDSGSYVMMDEARKWKILMMVDHHQRSPEAERISGEVELWDGTSPSNCQIVASALPAINENAAFALAIGIISDTARFKGGNAQSFEQLARMLGICGKTYAQALEYAEPERAADEKVFILSAFRKAEVVTYKDTVIATTVVSGNESDASSSISEFADIAFAASWRAQEKETRVSARARKSVQVKMNEIMRKVGEQFSSTGGGHAKAAGAGAKERPEKVLAACVEAVKDALDGI